LKSGTLLSIVGALVSKVGGVPEDTSHGCSGPGDDAVYQPPTGSPVQVFWPQQISGAAMF